jgi:MFS family permease
MFLGMSPRSSFPIFYVAMLDDFGLSRAETAGVFSVGMITAAVTMPAIGALFDRYGPKIVLGTGSLVMALGLVAASLTDSIWQLYISYGVVVTASMNALSVVPHTAIVSNWFTTGHGKALGFAVSGMGASYVMAILAQHITSNFGWRMGYLVLGILIAAIVTPLVLLFQRLKTTERTNSSYKQEDSSQDMSTLGQEKRPSEKRAESKGRSEGWTVRRALSSYQFWLVFFAFFLSGYVNFLVPTHQVAFNVDTGYKELLAASIVGLFGIANALGRLGGFISDRIGREGSYSLGIGGSILAVFLLLLARDPLNPMFLYSYALVFGLGVGLMGPSLLAAAADLFKGGHLGAIIGFMGLAFNSGGALGPWVGGYIHDILGGYDIAFYSSMVAAALSALFIWMARPSRAKRE